MSTVAATSPAPLRWIWRNLFGTVTNSVLTLLALAALWLTVPPFVEWAIIDAAWSGTTREACLAHPDGACWPFIRVHLEQLIYGRFPPADYWRANVAMAVGAVTIISLLLPQAPKKWFSLAFLVTAYPLIVMALLVGGRGGLEATHTADWGGLMLTLIVAVSGIVASLPLGVLLALGRRSDLPVISLLCTLFIEFWRGVPLITVLFMASVMLPLFLPDGVTFDKLLRCVIGVALFSSAYMAEVVRGGLQAIPKGQAEAADALGLSYWQGMGLIVIPQALRHVIPGIVNNFIGLFKDTTLVLIVGLFDLLGMVQFLFSNANWSTPQTTTTGYVFVAFVFWVFCFGMSRYSASMERRLGVGSAAGRE